MRRPTPITPARTHRYDVCCLTTPVLTDSSWFGSWLNDRIKVVGCLLVVAVVVVVVVVVVVGSVVFLLSLLRFLGTQPWRQFFFMVMFLLNDQPKHVTQSSGIHQDGLLLTQDGRLAVEVVLSSLNAEQTFLHSTLTLQFEQSKLLPINSKDYFTVSPRYIQGGPKKILLKQ